MSSSSETPPDTIMVSGPDSDKQNGDTPPAKPPQEGNPTVPKPKRLACMICRKRKLKCDGTKPSCSTCSRLGHTCAYDEVRRKSGPKRGYVKALEERLKQVETLLKTQDVSTTSPDGTSPTGVIDGAATRHTNHRAAATANFNVTDPSIAIASSRDMDRWHFNAESPNGVIDDFNFNSNITMGMNNVDSTFTWEMIGLGLEEPLPPQETIDELHQIYFEKIHPSVPMIHKYRYLAAMNLAPNQRPPVCLRYAMWTCACAVTDKYLDLKDLFYQRARKYVESDYIKGFGEHIISVAHVQAHVLLASYEFKWMYFPRAWMSAGSATRLAQMVGLHRLDGAGLDVKQCLPAPRDWTEREERRRTFWMAFCQDRYASIGTGWPMTIDEKDILTNLPSSEEAFEMSRPEQTQTLPEAMTPSGAGKLSAFGGIVLMACLFGRNLVHLHRPDVDDRDHDLNGEFWKRHRSMDNILLNTSLCIPSHLKLPSGLSNPNIVFTNMCIHTSTICLHQAAIFKADKNRLPSSVSAESKVRCITAANEIASIMRMISHMDLSVMNPFISFCLYVASRVFVQFLKSRPEDSQTADSLRFLLSAMNALKRRNPLTESFLVQLDVDLEALGLRIPKLKAAFPRSCDSPDPRSQIPPGMKMRSCDNAEQHGAVGIASGFRNEVQFTTAAENDGIPAAVDNLEGGVDGSNHTPSSTGHGSQSWSASEQQPSIVTRGERSNYVPLQGLMPPGISLQTETYKPHTHGGGEMDTAGSAVTSSSADTNRATPISSTTSQAGGGGLAAPGAARSSSGRNSFETSPVPSHQNLVTQGEVDRSIHAYYGAQMGGFGSMSPGGGGGVPATTGLTPDHHGRFGMPDTPSSAGPGSAGGGAAAGSGPAGNEFGMPQGWHEMAGQPAMTPVANGVLHSMLAMGPMETMDLGWDGGA